MKSEPGVHPGMLAWAATVATCAWTPSSRRLDRRAEIPNLKS